MPATYPIDNYGGLKQAIPDYLNSSERGIINALPSFINSTFRNLFNDSKFRINPFRDTIELTIEEDGTVDKPSDFLAAKHLYIKRGDGYSSAITRVNYDSVQVGDFVSGGYPEYYSDNGRSFIVYPAEVGSTIKLDYYYFPAQFGLSEAVSASNYVLINGGSGYSVDDVITATPATLGVVATFKVLTVDGSGKILTLSGVTSGENFIKGTTYSFTGGSGVSASIKIPTVDEETNWLVVNEPNLIIYGSCYEASLYSGDVEKAAMWKDRFDSEASKIIGRQKSDEFSGGTMVMSNGRGTPSLGRSRFSPNYFR